MLPPLAITGLAALGCATLLVGFSRLVSFIWTYVLRPAATFAKHKGKWAVVTGASSGIGAGLARGLAKKGINVMLVARSAERLKVVADDCERYGVETRIETFDFANADEEAWAEVIEVAVALEASVLVNNVGVNVAFPTCYVDVDRDDVERMLKVNIVAADKLTRALLPGMIAAKQGLILFMSSSAGVAAPAPLLAPYAGTKAYMDSFAIALSGEVRKHGVIVHSVAPFFVESPMAKMRRSFTVPGADDFARRTLAGIGGEPRLCPHWPHLVMASALQLLPLSMQVTYVANLHEKIRGKALRKQARLAAQQKEKSG